jgi:hypothetical protein
MRRGTQLKVNKIFQPDDLPQLIITDFLNFLAAAVMQARPYTVSQARLQTERNRRRVVSLLIRGTRISECWVL